MKFRMEWSNKTPTEGIKRNRDSEIKYYNPLDQNASSTIIWINDKVSKLSTRSQSPIICKIPRWSLVSSNKNRWIADVLDLMSHRQYYYTASLYIKSRLKEIVVQYSNSLLIPKTNRVQVEITWFASFKGKHNIRAQLSKS